jgi:hypothetical protein
LFYGQYGDRFSEMLVLLCVKARPKNSPLHLLAVENNHLLNGINKFQQFTTYKMQAAIHILYPGYTVAFLVSVKICSRYVFKEGIALNYCIHC